MQPLGLWILWNICPVILSSVIVVYLCPAASGSGVAQVKCLLNGVKIPEFLRIQVSQFLLDSDCVLSTVSEYDV